MEVSSLLTSEPTDQPRSFASYQDRNYTHQNGPHGIQSIHQDSMGAVDKLQSSGTFARPAAVHSSSATAMKPLASPRGSHNPASMNAMPKKVAFELLLDEGCKTRARIPMRVLINPHDATESIVTTVKNFYGIYEGHGVSFEDDRGNTLIARYENLVNDMTVYVRTVAGPPQIPQLLPPTYQGISLFESQLRPSLGEPFQMLPPQTDEHFHSPSRPASGSAWKRSVSPQFGRGRRSASQHKPGTFSAAGSRGSSTHGSHHEDAMNGYSDSDGGQSSITGSKRARSEQFASAEISLENVLQDGRRKRPNFESSELPLFVPPQVPLTTSTSSISPQRRSVPQEAPSPFARPAQKLYPYPAQLLPSPQHHGHSAHPFGFGGRPGEQYAAPVVPQHGHRLRDRSQIQSEPHNRITRAGYNGQGVLPTPDPTIASCISDEDVARQLIALGDASNFSHGRTSASTLDDAFSGVADAASSTGATSDSGERSDDDVDLPRHRKTHEFSQEGGDEDYEHENVIKSEYDEYDGPPRTKKIKTKAFDGASSKRILKTSSKLSKTGKIRSNTFPKGSESSTHVGLMKAPTAPASNPARKTSSSSTINFQHQSGVGEDDLSSKPRCQRCRKSKKGCDRQRPCQRCKDAGIGAEGCVSEDEGNGRRGRYGRHMGVPVRKSGDSLSGEDDFQTAGAILTGMAGVESVSDKNKKRKR